MVKQAWSEVQPPSHIHGEADRNPRAHMHSSACVFFAWPVAAGDDESSDAPLSEASTLSARAPGEHRRGCQTKIVRTPFAEHGRKPQQPHIPVKFRFLNIAQRPVVPEWAPQQYRGYLKLEVPFRILHLLWWLALLVQTLGQQHTVKQGNGRNQAAVADM
mmetsp:Transcript_2765/g.9185  ORF Transcript_2765/g.9185 Transcript_2765/m.9185 type:complete len:160 (+) Transcript_2765:574-1053(+)